MASPQVGVYFVIGMVLGVILSFFLSVFSPGYKSFTQQYASPTQRMVHADQHTGDHDNSIRIIQNQDKLFSNEQCNCSAICNVKLNEGGSEENSRNVEDGIVPHEHFEQVDKKNNGGSDVEDGIMSHEQLDKVNKDSENTQRKNYDEEDKHKHHDNDSKAKELYNEVKVLVWIMTQPSSLEKKARHVNITWAHRANKVMYASDTYDKDFPTMPIEIPHGRNHLTAKTMAAFDYVYKHHLDEFDWFMKADDDTFVIMENLRYFLSGYDPREPVYFGHLFKVIVKQGYYSGGGGYVLSREALRRFGSRTNKQCADDFGAEDVEFGRCMEKLGIKTQETLDNMGRTRFHCFNPQTHLHGGYPDWFLKYDKYDGKKQGTESVSDYAITFHYVSVNQMYDLEFFVYHLRPYGIQNGLQDLNIKRVKDIPPEVLKLETEKKTSDNNHIKEEDNAIANS